MGRPNMLLDRLPSKVKVRDVEYLVDTDFRTFVLFELLLQGEYKKDEAVEAACRIVYRCDPPKNVDDALEGIMWFYRCGEDISMEDGLREEQPYSFDRDHAAIYAAFAQVYGIRLYDTPMHWWEFRALFNGLTDTVFTERVNARMYSGKDVERLKLKREISIPKRQDKTVQLQLDSFNDIFYGG